MTDALRILQRRPDTGERTRPTIADSSPGSSAFWLPVDQKTFFDNWLNISHFGIHAALQGQGISIEDTFQVPRGQIALHDSPAPTDPPPAREDIYLEETDDAATWYSAYSLSASGEGWSSLARLQFGFFFYPAGYYDRSWHVRLYLDCWLWYRDYSAGISGQVDLEFTAAETGEQIGSFLDVPLRVTRTYSGTQQPDLSVSLDITAGNYYEDYWA